MSARTGRSRTRAAGVGAISELEMSGVMSDGMSGNSAVTGSGVMGTIGVTGV
jgi:hypothetical protein